MKPRWYWHRLRAMDRAEISARLRSYFGWWLDRSAAKLLDEFRIGAPAAVYPRLPDRVNAAERVRDAIAREAAALRGGAWALFGWNEARISDPPRWHRDYCNGVDLPPRIEARRLNYRYLPGGADARCVWEINRWAEVTRLAQNAWLNGHLEDARLAQAWLLDWCDKNPLGLGVNWCSSLEAALRLVNFCWTDALVRGCDDAGLHKTQDVLTQRIVPAHAWWVWRHRSLGSSANNHLLGELASLVLAARRWPSVGAVACSADQAWRLIAPEIVRQFGDDGGNREQALHYHLFAWELVWHARPAMGGDASFLAARIRAAAGFFCDLVHVREPWDFGDSDDAEVVPLTSTRRTGLSEWKAWLRGEDPRGALALWLGAPPPDVSPVERSQWRLYDESGLAVLDVNGWKGRVDGSPLGFGTMAAHGHLDAMHFSLWDGEVALVVDPGTGAYFGNPELRAKLASWEMHNGPLPLSGRTSPRRVGLFLWSDHHEAPAVSVAETLCSVRFTCEGHDLTRTVQYIAEHDTWRITDSVADPEPHVVRWRLAPAWKLATRVGHCFTIEHPSGHRATLTLGPEPEVSCEVAEDLVSPHFGLLDSGLVFTVTFRMQLVSQWTRLEAAERLCG